MSKRIRWITQTAVLLAMLIVLQAVTKPLGQIVTGSCVNTILAIATLLCGISSGITIAMLSPIFAFLLGIAPQIITVPAIMTGNFVFVLLLGMLAGGTVNSRLRQFAAWFTAATAKFAIMYILVVQIICGLASGALLGQKLGENVLLAPPMLEKLPAMFTWPQWITALIGGGLALLITPALRKALKK